MDDYMVALITEDGKLNLLGYLFNYNYNQFKISIQFLCLIFENISDILILWKKKDINI